MSSLNKVMIIGNLGADPEIKSTPNGTQVAQLSIATSESFTGRDGQRQEKTEWHRVVLWDKLADLAGRYLHKGSKVYIEGKLQTRSWDDPNSGQKRYATEIVGRQIQFLTPRDSEGGGERGGDRGGYGAPQQQRAPQPRQNASQAAQAPAGESEYFDDDIPF